MKEVIGAMDTDRVGVYWWSKEFKGNGRNIATEEMRHF